MSSPVAVLTQFFVVRFRLFDSLHHFFCVHSVVHCCVHGFACSNIQICGVIDVILVRTCLWLAQTIRLFFFCGNNMFASYFCTAQNIELPSNSNDENYLVLNEQERKKTHTHTSIILCIMHTSIAIVRWDSAKSALDDWDRSESRHLEKEAIMQK